MIADITYAKFPHTALALAKSDMEDDTCMSFQH